MCFRLQVAKKVGTGKAKIFIVFLVLFFDMSCNIENFRQQRMHIIYNKTHTKQNTHNAIKRTIEIQYRKIRKHNKPKGRQKRKLKICQTGHGESSLQSYQMTVACVISQLYEHQLQWLTVDCS